WPIGTTILLFLMAPAASMIAWELLVARAHRRAETGLDFDRPAPLPAALRRTAVKLAGLWGTWALIGLFYWSLPTYGAGAYGIYLAFLVDLLPMLVWLSAVYVLVIDRYSIDPEDGCWHMGNLVIGRWSRVNRDKVTDFLLSWLIKAFFLPFMVSILPGNIEYMLARPLSTVLGDAVLLAAWSVNALFLTDLCFGALGYIFTLRFVGTHIRSANPYLSAWVAALVCYPPFILMGSGGPLDYRDGLEWSFWLENNEAALWLCGGAVVLLSAFYVWATVIFGLRFSNLTHRGIITNGPYRLTKHPAYISKNIAWWLVQLPFLATAGADVAARNCVLLLLVNLIYYVRAKTEEKHLLGDPVYREYAEWIGKHGLVARITARIFPRRRKQ
ncbi:MAG: isoprenylcysteine carboxylmethyltransferase family protein, partial [Alphaproteobacteria bacterium]